MVACNKHSPIQLVLKALRSLNWWTSRTNISDLQGMKINNERTCKISNCFFKNHWNSKSKIPDVEKGELSGGKQSWREFTYLLLLTIQFIVLIFPDNEGWTLQHVWMVWLHFSINYDLEPKKLITTVYQGHFWCCRTNFSLGGPEGSYHLLRNLRSFWAIFLHPCVGDDQTNGDGCTW